jgi:hypothetical protein
MKENDGSDKSRKGTLRPLDICQQRKPQGYEYVLTGLVFHLLLQGGLTFEHSAVIVVGT